MMKTKYIALAVSLILSLSGIAQHNEEVTIEGTYRPKVNKVDKILMQPEKPQQSFTMPGAVIQVLDIEHRFPLEIEKMSALSYNTKNAQLPTPAKNFLMAGFGSRISPLFLYKHNSNLTKRLALGVGIKHYSSWLDIKDYAPSGFMNNALNIGLTSTRFKDVQMGWDVYYKNDLYHYYGLNLKDYPLTSAEIDDYCGGVTFNTIGTHFGLVPTSTRVGEVNHKVGVDYHYTFDNNGEKEHFADLEYGFGYTQNWWGSKSHPQKLGVDLGFQYDIFRSQYGVNGVNRMLFKVNPFFEMSDEFYHLHLGVLMDGATPADLVDKFFAVRPDVRGGLFVLDKKLEFYAGLNGGRKMFTYSEVVEKNPFYGSLPYYHGWRVQNVKLGFDGGVRTNIGEFLDLHLGVRYRHTDNDPLFVNNRKDDFTSIYNRFSLVYDETRLVSVLGDVRMKLRSGLAVELGVSYNHYDLSKYQYAWNRPAVEGRAKVCYDINDQLSFNASFLYQGGRYTATVPNMVDPAQVTGAKKLKDVYDLGFGTDWHVNEQLTVFVKLNNLANQRYQLYDDYPVEGFQTFAGLKMTF